MISGTPGDQQRHERVHDCLFIHHIRQPELAALRSGEAYYLFGGRARQSVPQRGIRVDKRCTGQVQAHEFHQHLVTVGRTVEGAGTGAMVRRAFGFQKFITANLAFGIELSNPLFFLVGKP